ncbi:hypothetical protein DFR42_11176 [Undibacterium pigrum]|uniref:Uncharacterized protein n=1 Tax=Undibacterium pigrum TaxID=401470 RepID=A0A318IVS7_9BURK|nr:hypothetical protein DFR42_11176 [Undibacterium pigrum]
MSDMDSPLYFLMPQNFSCLELKVVYTCLS